MKRSKARGIERRERMVSSREEEKPLARWYPDRTILLVEDDSEMRGMLAAALRRDGYTVVEAASGDDAVEWLGVGILEGTPERTPALIISDIRLPHLSGFDILEGAGLSAHRLPVILITGFGDHETHEMARELGAVCVLDKPFALEDLRAAVSAALRSRGKPSPARDGHVV